MLSDLDRLMYEILGRDGQSAEQNGHGFFGRFLNALKRPEKAQRNGRAAVAP